MADAVNATVRCYRVRVYPRGDGMIDVDVTGLELGEWVAKYDHMELLELVGERNCREFLEEKRRFEPPDVQVDAGT